MSLYFSKVLALLLLPLGWMVALALAALGLLLSGRSRAAGWVLVAHVFSLWFCSMPWTAVTLGAWWEGRYPPVALEETVETDTVLVLGGAVRRTGEPPGENLTDASDRVLRAARLYRAGKADRILVVGGNVPWLDDGVAEGRRMLDLLVEWGVPTEAILVEGTSRNTRENALRAAEMVRSHGWSSLLLVTSASHMERALGAFRAAGLEVIPSPTDFRMLEECGCGLLDFLPDSRALDATTGVLRELIGIVYYRWRGWYVEGRRSGAA